MTYTYSFKDDSSGKTYSFEYPSKAAYDASEEWWKMPGWKHIDAFAAEQKIKYKRGARASHETIMKQAFAVCIRWAEIWEEKHRLERERVYEAIEA